LHLPSTTTWGPMTRLPVSLLALNLLGIAQQADGGISIRLATGYGSRVPAEAGVKPTVRC
jgi:hypothetical protein